MRRDYSAEHGQKRNRQKHSNNISSSSFVDLKHAAFRNLDNSINER